MKKFIKNLLLTLFCLTIFFIHTSVLAINNYPVEYQNGLEAIKQEKYEEGLFYFSLLIEKHYDTAEIYFRRGYCNANLGRTKEALKDYNMVIDIEPDKYHWAYFAYSERGVINRSMHNYKDAIDDFSTAISLTDEPFYDYTQRTLCYISLKNYSKAKQDLISCLKLNIPFGTKLKIIPALIFTCILDIVQHFGINLTIQ